MKKLYVALIVIKFIIKMKSKLSTVTRNKKVTLKNAIIINDLSYYDENLEKQK